MRYFYALPIILIATATLSAEEPSKEELSKAAQAMVKSVRAGEYEKLAEYTYPKLIEFMGGKKKFIDTTSQAMKAITERGFEILDYSIGAPSDFYTEGENTFSIVPTSMKLKAPGARISTTSYLLGISKDKGKNWTFLDGAGLDKPELKDKILPKLPEKLTFPKQIAPVVEKTGK